jgi:hypothetical protein
MENSKQNLFFYPIIIYSNMSSDEEIPDYSNWEFKKNEIKNEEVIVLEEDDDEVPDYSNWGLEKKILINGKENIINNNNINNLVSAIQKQSISNNDKEEQWNFLAPEINDEDEESDENTKLSYDEWIKKNNQKKENSLQNDKDFNHLLKVYYFLILEFKSF